MIKTFNISTLIFATSVLVTACGGGGGGGSSNTPPAASVAGTFDQNLTMSSTTGVSGYHYFGDDSFTTLASTNNINIQENASSFNIQTNSVDGQNSTSLNSGTVCNEVGCTYLWREIQVDGQTYQIVDTNEQTINGVNVEVDGGISSQRFTYTNNNTNKIVTGDMREPEGIGSTDYMQIAYWEEINGALAGETIYDNKLQKVHQIVVGSYSTPDVVTARTGTAQYDIRMDGVMRDSTGKVHIYAPIANPSNPDDIRRYGRIEQAGYASGIRVDGTINMDFDANSFTGSAGAGGLTKQDHLGNNVYIMPTGIEISNGSIVANGINANITARNVEVVGVGTADMNGTMNGHFFGPQAQELGGTWSMNGGGNSAAGVITGKEQ